MPDVLYSPTTWADLPSTSSALAAGNLNKIENGVAAATGQANAAAHSAVAAGAPAHAPSGLAGRYTPSRCVYNWKGGNTRRLRASLARARTASGVAHWGVLGESTSTGYDGASVKGRSAWPYVLASYLAGSKGVPLGGDGLVNAADAVGVDPRWVYGSGWAAAPYYTFAYASTAGGVVTFTTARVGADTITVWFDDADGKADFTYRVDGGVAQTVTITNTGTIRSFTVTGLSTTNTHSVAVTAGGLTVLYGARATNSTSGLHVHNAARSSSGVTVGGAGGNIPGAAGGWNSTSLYNSVGSQARAMLPTALDVVFAVQGVNDVYPSAGYPSGQFTPAQTITALQTELGTFAANADVVLVLTPTLNGVNQATWDDYTARLYQLADTLDCPLIDWRDRFGGYAALAGLNLIGPDSLHPNVTCMDEQGRSVGEIVTS